jgi:hypothetical protein
VYSLMGGAPRFQPLSGIQHRGYDNGLTNTANEIWPVIAPAGRWCVGCNEVVTIEHTIEHVSASEWHH